MDGAQGVLLSIAGGSDLGLFEINEAASLVQEAAHPEANIIFGTVIDDSLGDEVRVTVIAAGFEAGTPTHKKLEPTAFGSAPRSANGNGASSTAPVQKTGSGYGHTPSNGYAGSGAPAQPAPATAHQAGTLPPAAPSYSTSYTAPPPRSPEAARREASGFGLPNTDAAEPRQPSRAAATRRPRRRRPPLRRRPGRPTPRSRRRCCRPPRRPRATRTTTSTSRRS